MTRSEETPGLPCLRATRAYEHASHTPGIDQPPPDGRLWVPVDKARTMALDVSEHAHLTAGLNQVARDTEHRRRVVGSPDEGSSISAGKNIGRSPSFQTHIARSSQSAQISLHIGADVLANTLATAA